MMQLAIICAATSIATAILFVDSMGRQTAKTPIELVQIYWKTACGRDEQNKDSREPVNDRAIKPMKFPSVCHRLTMEKIQLNFEQVVFLQRYLVHS